jgi:hypothetical protein
MQKMKPMITGSCACGAISYRIEGELFSGRSCHCRNCRKAFSAQASSCALVNPDEFSWVSGEGLLTSFINEAGAGLQFCSVCGSTLCDIVEGKVHGVTLGCVDGDPDISIDMRIYVGDKAKWEVIPEGVVQYEEGPTNEGAKLADHGEFDNADKPRV